MKENKKYLDNKNIEQICIGFIDSTTCSAEKTKEQINKVISHKINIYDRGNFISWDKLYDTENKNTRIIFNNIIEDRKIRVDEKNSMADSPNFAVCTFIDDVCERIEYYEGHDKLEKVFDIRSRELQELELEDFLTDDTYAYNPIDYLNSKNSNEEKMMKDMLEILHSSSEEELIQKTEKYLNNNNNNK